MRILAAVTVYNPDLALLKASIASYINEVDGVWIWDNGVDAAASAHWLDELKAFSDKLTVDGMHANVGISQALNKAIQYAAGHGYDALLTMDQDSVFLDFHQFKQHALDWWASQGECAIGPLTCNLGNEPQTIVEKHHIITSGMLIPLRLLQAIGGYDGNFFVDGVDVDLCYNLHKHGFKVMRDNASVLNQHYGEPISKRILGLTLHSPNYSPFRLHGIFRNHIIIWRKYHHPWSLLSHIVFLYFMGFVVKGVLLVEDDKLSKLKAVARGIKEGLFFKMKA